MSENSRNMEEYYDEESTIDWVRYLNILKSHWKTVLKWSAVLFAVGCLVALGTPHKYRVTSKLVPEGQSGGANNMPSLASIVGMSSSKFGTNDAISPLIYPDLVKSNEFMSAMFEAQVTFVEGTDTLETSLFEYMSHHRKRSMFETVLSFPVRFFASEEPSFTHADPFHFTKVQDGMASAISQCIDVYFDRKTMLVNIGITMPDPLAATDVARHVIDYLKSYITRYRIQKSMEDLDYYERMFSEAQDEYYRAQCEYSSYSDSHQGVTLRSYMIESERLKNEASMKYELYNTMAHHLQASRAKVQQETPVFAEIIPPSVPIHPVDSRKRMALAFGIFGLILGCGYVLWKYRREENV